MKVQSINTTPIKSSQTYICVAYQMTSSFLQQTNRLRIDFVAQPCVQRGEEGDQQAHLKPGGASSSSSCT